LIPKEPSILSRILKLSFLPTSMDAGILFLRITVGLSLFIKHGYEKVFTFSIMAPVFSDPMHIGATNSLILAMISDGICSLLVVIGAGTRLAALAAIAITGPGRYSIDAMLKD
jgi:putative oxidoreductase